MNDSTSDFALLSRAAGPSGRNLMIQGRLIFRPTGQEEVIEYRLEQQHPTRDEVSMFQTRNWFEASEYVGIGWKCTPLTQETINAELQARIAERKTKR